MINPKETPPQCTHKITLSDRTSHTVVSNLTRELGQPIISHIEWCSREHSLPTDIIDKLLDIYEWHSLHLCKSFEQAMTLPSGRVLCWRFEFMKPPKPCLQSASTIVGKGLFDAPPSKITPTDYREALRGILSPDRLAAMLSALPEKERMTIASKFVEPPVARQIKLVKSSKK